MIGVKVVLFIVMSLISVPKIDEPTQEVIRVSQGHYGEGSVWWTFDDGMFDNAYIIMELMNGLHGKQSLKQEDNPYRKKQEESLNVLTECKSSCSLPRAHDVERGTYTSMPALQPFEVPEPCQPGDEPLLKEQARNGPQNMARFPTKSALFGFVIFENVVSCLFLWTITGGCPKDEASADMEGRTVAMLEGRVMESLPSEKLSDDSCVIVNLSPSNSQEVLSEEDEEPFEIVDI